MEKRKEILENMNGSIVFTIEGDTLEGIHINGDILARDLPIKIDGQELGVKRIKLTPDCKVHLVSRSEARVLILKNILVIEAFCFYNMTQLEAVHLDAKYIYEQAFAGCKSLQVLKMTNPVIIDDGAFYDCPISGEVCIPQTTSVGRDAFSRCTRVKRI